MNDKATMKTNITIVGIGGVGGYFGGLLAKHFYNNGHVVINFIAWGNTLKPFKPMDLKWLKALIGNKTASIEVLNSF